MADQTRCMSVKSKGSSAQCPHKRKPNSDYCGIHIKVAADRIVRVIDNAVKHTIVKKEKTKSAPKTYSKEYLFSVNDPSDLSRNIILKTAKELGINYVPSDSRVKIYKKIIEYHNCLVRFSAHADKIIAIQSLVRRFLVRNRTATTNDEDFMTLESKYNIPPEFYISYLENKHLYGFDIRSIKKLIEVGKMTNPFTCVDFTDELIVKYHKHIDYLNDKQIIYEIEKPKLSKEQEYIHFLNDVFHKFDLLGNYTDPKWFNELEMYNLKRLYKKAEDVFNYRANLPHSKKCDIVNNGIVFSQSLSFIEGMPNSKKRDLQYMLLRDFDRMATEGRSEDDRKVGVMLVLTALVEVSPDAAMMMPQYLQDFD